MTKQVLMICYYFPPISASGVTRSLEFAKLLPNFGWQPLVLTVRNPKDRWNTIGTDPDPDGICIERTAEWNLSGIADFLHGCFNRIAEFFGKPLKRNFFRDCFCFPDSQIAWLSTSRARILARKCDLIYVSCSPFSSSLSAVLVKWLTGRRLVVDFRDAWSLNPGFHYSLVGRSITNYLERVVLSACDALIVNTDGAARLYSIVYPEYREKIVAIPNGYDRLTLVDRRVTTERFQIMHVGSFYGSRNPDLLLECLAELRKDDVVFVQVGGTFDSYEQFKDKVKIKIIPRISRNEALELMRDASLLYLKQGKEAGVSEYIWVGAKTYEYLATGLPILADVPPGDNAELVDKYASVGYVVTSGERADLRHAVLRAYEARSRASGAIHSEFVKKFSRKELTRQLAALFDELTAESDSI